VCVCVCVMRKFILYTVSKKRGESNKEHIGVLARINVNK
jgi:hypothetical protein